MSRLSRRAGAAALVFALGAAGATLLASPASALTGSLAVVGSDDQVNCTTNTVPVTLSNSGTGVDQAVTFTVRLDLTNNLSPTYTIAPNGAPVVVNVPVARNSYTTVQVSGSDGYFTGRQVTSLCDVPSGEDLVVSITDPNCFYQTGVFEPFPAVVFSASNAGNDGQAAYAFLVDGSSYESGTLQPGESRVRSFQLVLNANVTLAIETVDDEGDPLTLITKTVNPGACYSQVTAPPATVTITGPEPVGVQGTTPTGDNGQPLTLLGNGQPANAFRFGFGAPDTSPYSSRSVTALETDFGTLAYDPELGDVTFTVNPDAVVVACTPVLETVPYYVVGRTYVSGNIVPDPTNVATGVITVSLATTLVDPFADDDVYSVTLGSSLETITTMDSLLLNDCDQTGASPALAANVSASLTTQALHGTVAVNADGSFSYRPATLAYSGTDTFTYTITTIDAGAPRSSTATVTLQIQGTTVAAVKPPTLAATGSNTAPLTVLGGGLLLLGAGALVIARRRDEDAASI